MGVIAEGALDIEVMVPDESIGNKKPQKKIYKAIDEE